MYENILYEVKDHVGYLTINRPKALNALCTAVLEEIDDCLDTKIAPDNDVHVVVVTGAGRAFVAGADISEMQTKPVLEGHDYTELGHKVMDKIDNSAVRPAGSRPGHYPGIRRHPETAASGGQGHGEIHDPGCEERQGR